MSADEDEDDWTGPVMLILRGNSGSYPDEDGNTHKYTKGALHEGPAKELARVLHYNPKVLDVSGNAKPPKRGEKHGTRDDSEQTLLALRMFRLHSSVVALYGFSGGGYNVWWILKGMTEAERGRIERVVVVGVDTDRPQSAYDKSQFKGGGWDLIYRPNHPANHMGEPKALLDDLKAKLAPSP